MENKYLSLTNKVFHVMNDEKHSDDDLIRNLTEWKSILLLNQHGKIKRGNMKCVLYCSRG